MAKKRAEIPDKIFFSIGEVSKIAGVKAHVIRYWETEFPTLKPQKRSDGRRVYRSQDVDLILRIKDLLYREKFTIAGARRRLAGRGRTDEAPAGVLDDVKRELAELADELEEGLNG
ncbi:MAG: MerR family transcriptional regulator [Candidatus Coatesbacteria bacterium]|nr:MAG: MerR family transcriptional regulator [Candidatus Coatesbacteria bacterium]